MTETIYETKFESLNTYLDFKDVLILPKKSNLNSRKEVVLERTIFFSKWSKMDWNTYCGGKYDNNWNIRTI